MCWVNSCSFLLPPSPPPSLPRSLAPSLTTSLTHSLPPPPLPPLPPPSLPRSLAPSLTTSLTPSLPPLSLAHSLPPSLPHSLTPSLSPLSPLPLSLAHSLPPSLPHSLPPSPPSPPLAAGVRVHRGTEKTSLRLSESQVLKGNKRSAFQTAFTYSSQRGFTICWSTVHTVFMCM